jgi:polysaccharide export outer membrane protein
LRQFLCTILIVALLIPDFSFAQQASPSVGSSGQSAAKSGAPASGQAPGQVQGQGPGISPYSQQQAAPPQPDSPVIQNSLRQLSPDEQKRLEEQFQQNGPKLATQNTVGATALPLTQFENFVANSLGYPLPLFGYSLFENGAVEPPNNVPVTANYAIGPGDEVQIRAWGQLDVDFSTEVDRNGDIFIPKIGNVHLAGVSVQDLQGTIRQAIGRYFQNFELRTSLGGLRSIQVFIMGHAARPGTYTVSALSTVLSALFAAGGPDRHGSMRKILLKRGSKTVATLDLYKLLLEGNTNDDARLLQGDVIFIPPAGERVAVTGTIKVPGIYELTDGRTLNDLVKLAGGFTATVRMENASVQRIAEHATRTFEEIPMTPLGMASPLRDGDIVEFPTVSPRVGNVVMLRGHVAKPGRYPYKPGMHLRDILPDPKALIPGDYWSTQNQQVIQATDTSNGASVRLGRLAQEMLKLAGDVNWDYAVIERMNPKTLVTDLIPFNLGKMMLDKDEANDLTLEPGDVITIFSQDDVRVPVERRTRRVIVEGEVEKPGVFLVAPGESLRDLVRRAGGLTPHASLFASKLLRESVRTDEQQQLSDLVHKLEQNMLVPASQPLDSKNYQASLDQQSIRQQQQQLFLTDLRQISAEGRVVLELKPDATLDDLPQIEMEDGDTFVVPAASNTVAVYGAVKQSGVFLMDQNRAEGVYLQRAGGVTRRADKGALFVVRANGAVVVPRGRGLNAMRALPGDTIIVPGQFGATKLDKFRSFAEILAQFALGAAAAKVLAQ